MNYKVLGLEDSLVWRTYIENLPKNQQDIYFFPEYYRLYQENGDGKAKCFVYENSDGFALYPFLINSVNDLGYDEDKQYFDIQGAYGYNGIIASNTSNVFANHFYNAFKDYVEKENIIAEFTRFHPLIGNHNFHSNITVIEDRKTVYLNITENIEDIWKNNYSGVNRNMIRKAKKEGITFSITDNTSDYDVFFELYCNTMRNLAADDYYYFSKDYFSSFKNSLKKNHKLLLAKYNNKVICGLILMFCGEYAHYHLSARNNDFAKFGVNNLLLNEAIIQAKQEGCVCFHFGGGTTNLETDTLLKFKKNFSKSMSPFYIGKKVHNESVYQKLINIWIENNQNKSEYYKNHILKYRY